MAELTASVHVDSHHLFTNSLGAHCQAALSAAAENSLQTPLGGALLCGVGSCCQQPAALGSRSNEPCLAQASSGPYPNTLSSLLLPLASTLLGFGLLGHLIFFLGFPKSTPAAHPVSQPAFTLEVHLSHIWPEAIPWPGSHLETRLFLPILDPGSHSRTPPPGMVPLPSFCLPE